jgi:ubiquinone/menaquinone biosynthesis C-methylase UbiE
MLATTSRPVNYWPESACARAFWSQQEVPPYQRLLADTASWLDPQPGEYWLDLGCGSGQLTRTLWTQSGGNLAEIVGLDCAPVNVRAFQKLQSVLQPSAADHQIRFVASDFSAGLPDWPDGQFHGVVSGLAIQYAECYSEQEGRWTTEAYDRLLAEVYRVLRKQGRFVFSVNVPEPAWGKVAFQGLAGLFRARRPAHYLKNSWRMLRYGAWLSHEARQGRFHYLPVQVVVAKLAAVGFAAIEHRLSYAGQAYLFRCRKLER